MEVVEYCLLRKRDVLRVQKSIKFDVAVCEVVERSANSRFPKKCLLGKFWLTNPGAPHNPNSVAGWRT
jgi:hypothetical protein